MHGFHSPQTTTRNTNLVLQLQGLPRSVLASKIIRLQLCLQQSVQNRNEAESIQSSGRILRKLNEQNTAASDVCECVDSETEYTDAEDQQMSDDDGPLCADSPIAHDSFLFRRVGELRWPLFPDALLGAPPEEQKVLPSGLTRQRIMVSST